MVAKRVRNVIALFSLRIKIFCRRRGIPMALFSLAAIGGAGLGPLMSGWIEVNPHLGWRWIQWIQMMYEFVAPLSFLR
jgi:MFS family permease